MLIKKNDKYIKLVSMFEMTFDSGTELEICSTISIFVVFCLLTRARHLDRKNPYTSGTAQNEDNKKPRAAPLVPGDRINDIINMEGL